MTPDRPATGPTDDPTAAEPAGASSASTPNPAPEHAAPPEPASAPVQLPVDDEVLAHRARLARFVKIGKRYGYGLFAYAVVAFVVGAIVGFSDPLVTTIVAAMAIGSALLAPAIVFGFGIRAAEREEREEALRAAGHHVPERRSGY